ncbi:hypothetical protein HC028_00970 [Planosporangium flavigriseum]|uniref:hypothetical protein n=1 Tax=Planosporangium flavigriseum TaxID=373681 RepID=UPI001438CBB2|nr:hypothetical protein [Planosporangium flavigriseum]NJC63094.1 hypothetical protein [Planosporangium flavigriseum]
MATGISSGLLDERRVQSLFKQTILGPHAGPFAVTIGFTVAGQCVAAPDAFSGQRFDPDGGSAFASAPKASVNASWLVDEPALVATEWSAAAQMMGNAHPGHLPC